MKINATSPLQVAPLIQAINGENRNLAKIKKFRFVEKNSVRSVSALKNVMYKGVRLVKGKRMYVVFYYRIPPDLPLILRKPEFLSPDGSLKQYGRFRIFQDINRTYDADYPDELLQGVKDALEGKSLESPYDPFAEMIATYKQRIMEEKAKSITMADAIEKFLSTFPKDSDTQKAYKVISSLLQERFGEHYNDPLIGFTQDDLETMLFDCFDKKHWKKLTFNDKVRKLKTMFKYFKSKKLITEDITVNIKLKAKVGSAKHMYYDVLMAEKVKSLLLKHEDQPMGKFVHDFFKCIYYTCSRPDKETRVLRCGDVQFDREVIYFVPDHSKGEESGHVPIDPDLKKMFLEMGVHKAPKNWYIFGSEYKPGPICMEESEVSNWFRTKVRVPNNLDSDYTPYGWKHTRVIRLFMHGWTLQQLKDLCRHKLADTTEQYLRNIGCYAAKKDKKIPLKF
jgi:site-specific recombinase XerD